MSLELPFGIRPLNPLPDLDIRYGTYNSISDALTATQNVRAVGLTVGIIESGKVVEYQFKEGILDSHLVRKAEESTGFSSRWEPLSERFEKVFIPAQRYAVVYNNTPFVAGFNVNTDPLPVRTDPLLINILVETGYPRNLSWFNFKGTIKNISSQFSSGVYWYFKWKEGGQDQKSQLFTGKFNENSTGDIYFEYGVSLHDIDKNSSNIATVEMHSFRGGQSHSSGNDINKTYIEKDGITVYLYYTQYYPISNPSPDIIKPVNNYKISVKDIHDIANTYNSDLLNRLSYLKRSVLTRNLPKNYQGALDLSYRDNNMLSGPIDYVFINQLNAELDDNVIITSINIGETTYQEIVLFFNNIPKITFKKDSINMPYNQDLVYHGYGMEYMILSRVMVDKITGYHSLPVYREGFSHGVSKMTYGGVLYNHFAVRDIRDITPEGWRVPNFNDYQQISDFVGTSNFHNLRAGRSFPGIYFWWSGSSLSPTHPNIYEFNSLPIGGRAHTGGFSGRNQYTYYWTSHQNSPGFYRWFGCAFNSNNILTNNGDQRHGFSLRLIKEDPSDWEPGDLMRCNSGIYYNTCKVGNQVWMAQNMASRHYRNGDSIPLVNFSSTEWAALTTPACCLYNNDLRYY